VVLNNKTRSSLIDLISPLDGIIDYRETPMFQDGFEVVGGRLPTADKKIVGDSGFTEVILTLSNEHTKSQYRFGA
jgi:hypothetical protein